MLLINEINVKNSLNIYSNQVKASYLSTSEVSSLVVLSNELFASGSGNPDFTIKIWNLDTGLMINALNGHTNRVSALVQLNKTTLASASFDETIKIW